MSYKEKLIKIKNFVFDVDGVFTDGSIIVDNSGNELRVFSTRDGIAVKLATDKGYNFCVISGGKNEGVRKRLNKLGIKNVYLGVNNKMEVFKSFMNDNNLKTTETMFMGDDIPDIQILKMVGLSCCPNDAANEVREVVDYISIKKGGEGCVRDIIEQILTIQKNWIENE
jgi:3-deoxy-D-manno-octulosonate 8-phosphate phosphatase (KDO 8-P phosphatase)|tara:strand:+ start:361 stop:867 length:507 start_codon:yes stop_codon:yes gene_type:complete